ncbi:hypothetical protein I9H06_16330 [Pseudomonas tremae]|uniref:hypothetical protein n=1 Tax=Pseudomonas syringae group TaxID=136849 RepID=UPI0011C3C420|nr:MULTISPECIES: hypothetical protein [Pseudomonas syringae group]MCF5714298.1 hypothetical protein [Pseudomonas tremae]UQB29935.1 hypothetical protein I9H06_16330 [Pseudomonas tremae]
MSEDIFTPRPAFTIDWVRQYDSGPSDPHLHAMGQFIANYSAVEWKLAELFALALGKPIKEAQQLTIETNMPMAGMIRYTKQSLSKVTGPHGESAKDLITSIEAFERVSPIRHKIVHWQWGLDEGEDATLTDFIKPKSSAKSCASLPLDELRGYCLSLARIFRAVNLGLEVMAGRWTRQQILEAHKETSPERLFRP